MSNNVMKWCRYLAGSMFAITALGDLAYMIPEHFSLSMLMIILANLLMSISMFAEILPMFAAGSGVFALNKFITLFSSGNILYAILGTATYVLAFLFIINRKNALKLGLSAALVLAIRSIWVTTIGCGYWTGLSWIVSQVEHDYLYMAAPLILAAIVVQYTTEEHSTKIQPAKANTEKTSPTDRIGELTKLKELLDMGAITQTEFDEKKKEMLNL